MFDAETARLMRQAPALRGVDSETLPQQMTAIFAELTALRLRADQLEAQPERLQVLEQLRQLATIYEAVVDTGAVREARRASAFVAGTAHQLLARVFDRVYGRDMPLLGSDSIHPSVAAPLLFLIAEQNADAREAGRALLGRTSDDLIQTALVETLYDLSAERFEEILLRAARLQRVRVSSDGSPEVVIGQALYGLCWSGVVQLAARLLNREMPQLSFVRIDNPQAVFDEVVRLSEQELQVPGVERPFLSVYTGPRHLARLLRSVAEALSDTGIVYVPTPGGADGGFWSQWLRHRAKSKPLLWRNHRAAIDTGILERGRSTVLVLPTGAGKTTLSELKIAATLARDRKVVFLVPTLALVDQLRDDLTESFPASFADVEVSIDGDLLGLISTPELQAIEVMTPERCLALLSHNADAMGDVGLVVFDECHLLSPQGGGKRSLDAMLCLLQVITKAHDADLLLLSAMLTNAEEFSDWIAEITQRPCSAFVDPWKPSRQARGVVVYSRGELDQITRVGREFVAQQRRGERNLVRPNTSAVPYCLFGLHQNWNPAAAADIRLIKLSDTPISLNLSSQGRPTPSSNDVAAKLAVQAVAADLKTIVFVQQAGYAPLTATKIAAQLPRIGEMSETETQLWNSALAELGGEQYSLVKPHDAALPHNGDMIPLERRLVESLFRKSDGATAIVATPTLAQGMNLPAQLAILASDKRHDAAGRVPLEAHEILNAAGRAGRAGHLANGLVIMVSEPVVAFSQQGRPEPSAFAKLGTLLPSNDQCVLLEDPVTNLLDRIQAGDVEDVGIRYFVSRVRPIEDTLEARDASLNLVRRSFAGFRARRANAEVAFDQKLQALGAILAAERPANAEMAVIAASSGFADEPLVAIEARLQAEISALPISVTAWSDWLIEFFKADRVSYGQLLGNDADTVLYVMRGKKTGGPPSDAEFDRLKDGLRAWLSGQPFCDIERALSVEERKIKRCARTRDLVLKLASRSLYLIIAATAEAARVVIQRNGAVAANPSLFEALPAAFRKGFDTVDKVAFAQARPHIRSRVLAHRAFTQEIGAPMDLVGRSYLDVVDLVNMRLAFGGVRS
jgi:ATP-dependent RNA helicase HelY